MVLWWGNERIPRWHLHVAGSFFASLLMKFFKRFFSKTIFMAWLYLKFVVKHFSGTLFIVEGWRFIVIILMFIFLVLCAFCTIFR